MRVFMVLVFSFSGPGRREAARVLVGGLSAPADEGRIGRLRRGVKSFKRRQSGP